MTAPRPRRDVCLRITLTLVMGAAIALFAPARPTAAAPPRSATAGMTVGYAVFDRQTGRFTERRNSTTRFRSASVVKLLIALDQLWTRDPGRLSAKDRSRLTSMLRSSNDGAATYFWNRGGNRNVALRMAKRLKLRNTVPPPSSLRGWWGYVGISAEDVVRIYRFILDSARRPVRDFIMGNLSQATTRAGDGFNQKFGLLTFAAPRAVKQGWSGFGGNPPSRAKIPGLDLRSDALHTTGTTGRNNRFVVALFTLHGKGTRYATACAKVTNLTRYLVPPKR
ncbi:hypothetical protein [Micromonospora sp. NPDC049679]|uniref:hypothetical protein n=1 Tax=Micromonospora sp. NPDC049679 TaxID=3155920 RepID=UPI0033C31835